MRAETITFCFLLHVANTPRRQMANQIGLMIGISISQAVN